MNFTGSLDLAQSRMVEQGDVDAPRRHSLADLLQEFGEDAHLVLGRVAAQARLARDAVGVDLGRRGAAALDREPEIAVAAELDVLDHRDDRGLDVVDGLRRERRRPRVEALALLPLLLVTASDRIWIVYVVAFAEACIEQFFVPA